MFEENNYNLENESSSEIKFTNEELKFEEINKRRWKNRREMAWKAFNILMYQIYFILFLVLLLIVIVIFKPDLFESISKVTTLTEVFVGLLIAINFYFAGIVFAYIGGNVIEKIKSK
jgi:ABC-type multidrug transport system fused ATPase/permease subunit